MVVQADSTLAAIRKKIRRLTASSGESTLTTDTIDQAINTFYNNDFPYAIKLDQMRNVYTFYTSPYIDRYPLDVNYNQGIRAPVYFDGIKGFLYKDRDEFFNMWPRWPSSFQPFSGDGTTQSFTFQIQGPFLSGMVTLGIQGTNGEAINVADDGNGNLFVQNPAPVVTVPNYPAITPAPGLPVPGMLNKNTGNPGLVTQIYVGTVNYVTGQFAINYANANVTPASGQTAILRVSQYQAGRPYCLMFWNNEFTIRPIPKQIHKVEVETYLTPVQFMAVTDHPIINQWWEYLSYGSSMEILRERQDFDGVENLREGFLRQEQLVLERQGVEEIGQRNATIFSGSSMNQGWNNGFFQGWY